VDAVSVSLLARCAGHRRNIVAGVLLREREGGEPLAAADLWQNKAALLAGARDGDGACAQALHGEGEVGEAVVERERLASETDAARVDRRRVGAGRRDRCVEQARFAERAGELTARPVDVAMIDARDCARGGEAIERAGKGAMGLAEERPVEPVALELRGAGREAHQSPSKTGFCLAAKASKARRKSWVVMQM